MPRRCSQGLTHLKLNVVGDSHHLQNPTSDSLMVVRQSISMDMFLWYSETRAGLAELADAPDSKSGDRKVV